MTTPCRLCDAPLTAVPLYTWVLMCTCGKTLAYHALRHPHGFTARDCPAFQAWAPSVVTASPAHASLWSNTSNAEEGDHQ